MREKIVIRSQTKQNILFSSVIKKTLITIHCIRQNCFLFMLRIYQITKRKMIKKILQPGCHSFMELLIQ